MTTLEIGVIVAASEILQRCIEVGRDETGLMENAARVDGASELRILWHFVEAGATSGMTVRGSTRISPASEVAVAT